MSNAATEKWFRKKQHPSVRGKSPLDMKFINPQYCTLAIQELFKKKFGIGKHDIEVTILNSLKYPGCYMRVTYDFAMPELLINKFSNIGWVKIFNGSKSITAPVGVWKKVYNDYLK